MAPYIRARRYIGVDLDEEALERGRRRGRDRQAVLSTIEDMPADLTGDFVLCLQTVGINRLARVDLTMTHLRRMIAATRPGGALVLNVGALSGIYFGPVEQELRQAFRTVEVVEYGRFRSKRLFPLFLFLIWLMELRPESAVSSGDPTKLFIAEGRL